MDGIRVGLVMIVRNEEAAIKRALASAKPWISTWVICDTGSTDRTKEIIRDVMADVSGLLVDCPWVSFEKNRTEALELCRGRMDWAIMLDADDTLEGTVPSPDMWTRLGTDIDGLKIRILHGDIQHQRIQIFRIAADWYYRGVLHEAAHCRGRPEGTRVASLPDESYMVARCEGFRSRDPDKYLKDACILEAEWARNPGEKRTLFYLAQSWRDAGRPKRAAQYYREYVDTSGGWIQERYMSFVNLINLTSDHNEKLALAWRALEIAPNRLEAQYAVLKGRRLANLPATHQMYSLGVSVTNRKSNTDMLFITPTVYEWEFDDEFAVIAFATGHYREAYEASMRAALGAPTAEMRDKALKNAATAKARGFTI
jgi:glycosyltransferase involved in cell wall biosynthesis